MTRKAHILTIEKRYEVALEIYRALEKRSIQRDVAVYYIKALLGSNVKKNQSEALEICLENIFNSNSKGHHHEGLIFRVLLSNIFRSMNLLEVAERNMDLVQSDILNYGCSERTFLAFLLEAGIILNCQERYTRAYAMFLKPCLLRAHNRSLSEYKSEAKYQATHSLMSLKDLLHTSNDIHYKQNIIRDLMTKNEFSCTESKLNSRHRLPIDPLSSYDFVYPENTINRLCKSNGLELELSKLSKIGD